MPRQLQVCLKDVYSTTLSGTPGQYLQIRLGMFEPLGRTPAWMATLYTLYKYAKIVRWQVDMDVVNLSSDALQTVSALVPFADSTLYTNINVPGEQPGAIVKLISPKGGIDKIKIKHDVDLQKLLGDDPASKWWITQAQSQSSSPLSTEESVFIAGFQPATSVSWTAFTRATVRYHFEFFDLELLE